jgi:hypothetical protein
MTTENQNESKWILTLGSIKTVFRRRLLRLVIEKTTRKRQTMNQGEITGDSQKSMFGGAALRFDEEENLQKGY